MRSLNILLAFEIGDRSGHLQDSRISTRAQPKFIDGQFEKLLAGFIDLAELLDMTVGHLGVAANLQSLESFELDLAGSIHPFLDFTGDVSGDVVKKLNISYGRVG
jgi:hypothetical protein